MSFAVLQILKYGPLFSYLMEYWHKVATMNESVILQPYLSKLDLGFKDRNLLAKPWQ